MRRILRIIGCTLIVLVSAALPLAAQTGVIHGRVADSMGIALPDASVEIEGTRLRATTNDNGRYEITDVPAGVRTLQVRLIGYVAASARTTVGEGATVERDFTLSRAPYQLGTIDVLVGSRARHTAADELAVPVDVFPAEVIRQQGTTETSQILQELSPSVNFPRQSVTDADDIVRPFTMRGLSPDHTLVLVNGLRRHRTALVHIFGYGMGAGSSGVDLNALPASAIDRIEVLRDGAAAQYGSDAIAGVVNIGIKDGTIRPFLTADVGRYTPGDFPDDGTTITAGGGLGFRLGRGSVGLFGEFRDRDPTNRAGADPEDQIVEGDADVIDEDGKVVEKRNPVPQPNHHWGDGSARDILSFANLRLPVGAAGTSEVYAFGGYSFREGRGQGFRRQGISDRNWPEIYPLGYLPTFAGDVRDASAAAGVRGLTAGWNYDVGASFGHNGFDYNLENTLNVSLGPCLDVPCAPGLDGVLGTADDPGIPNKTEIFAGTLRLNELVANVDLARPFELGLPAPVHVALGAAFRSESYEILAGEPASYIQGGHPNRNGEPAPPGSQVFGGFQPSNEVDESRTNVGVYVDAESELTSQFLVNVAGRFESYSDFGERLTGKLAMRFQPSRRVTFRGAIGTGFRAPALSQSFYGSTITNFELDEATGIQRPVEVGIFPVDDPVARVLGARPLTDETSVNVSAGFAVTPVDALTLTADYFLVRIDDRIILTGAISGDSVASILAGAGLSVEAAQYFTNALDTRTQGVDVTANYRVPMGGDSRLDLTGVFNYTKNKILRINEPPELAGTGAVLFDSVTSGGIISLEQERPLWRTSFTAQYGRGRFHGLARTSVWGKFTSAQIGACAEGVQTYGTKALFDAEVGYRFLADIDVSVGVRNLFDTYPDRPSLDNSFGIFIFPAASPFGYNGRFVYARTEVVLGG